MGAPSRRSSPTWRMRSPGAGRSISPRTCDSGWRRAAYRSSVCRFIATHKCEGIAQLLDVSGVRLRCSRSTSEAAFIKRVLLHWQRHPSHQSILDRCGALRGLVMDVPDEEPAAGNALLIRMSDHSASFPKTRALLERADCHPNDRLI